MVTIKKGFDDKELVIRVNAPEGGHSNNFELWIDQGANDGESRFETLSYMTADEMRKLVIELKEAGKSFFE